MIKVYNRKTKTYDIEQVAGLKYINWSYSSPVGKSFVELFVKKKIFSKVYGNYCDSSLSKKKIQPFIDEFNIDMSLCNKNINEFENFNDFFARTLTNEARPIDFSEDILISPGDGRLSAFENIDLDNVVQIKGFTYSLRELIDDPKVAEEFKGGTCLILRLCPTDYHRFHFVDNGTCGETKKISGFYYSVNPIALNNISELFCKNKREWSLFNSDNFGEILHVEVGATCVGTILQTYTPGKRVTKGEEKGYFKFGGSTTILFFKKGMVKVDSDIVEQTKLGFETKVNMGETIGHK
ncbi:phosphatidylserine decarboxylase [Clostridium sp. LIBA-8841]|uniref:phosphatidylserine decarboxylase n=1 Tax=Clostridium sp. LIBA-8841 TaxID=2987530 RepID=UPI002AC7A6FD|nr:phosphatidylserine decarboxylase [Clostridium sp. LIBA-8841]MDZ5255333.1 phosphatidylserine decarboxylase [Clostridium sp. LIBA-8841]